MSERKRLIAMLMDKPFGRATEEEETQHIEDVADYLIANGVEFPVHCKECIYNKNGCCTHSEIYDDTKYRPDYFCADGERTTDVITNGDRVRTMSNEELAEWSSFCPHIEEECALQGCTKCVLEWLQQPVNDKETECFD